jgi:hypothetical protein
MKQKIFVLGLFLLAASAAFYFVSCKKEKVYSCNDKLNDYATITKKLHQGISRDSLVKFGLDTQFAIMASLLPENKARILKEKIVTLLNDDAINDDDKVHLNTLYKYITPAIYENEHQETDTFLNQWKDFAYNSLHWDQKKMEIYMYIWLTESEMNGIRGGGIYLEPAPREGGGGGEYNCNCVSGYLCETVLRRTCIATSCNKVRNCGFFWNEYCWGRCS